MSTVADDLLKKIKANQPEDLIAGDDVLGTIPKGDIIKGFLDSLLNRENTNIQMIALYGEWGSGKTSLMKYVQSKLDEEPINFSTIFFEAWQFENDKNLAMSLLTSLLKKHEVEGNVWQKKDEILKRLKILTKSAFAGYSFGYNASKLVEIFEKESSDDSFHAALDYFKTEYRNMEDNLLKDIQNEKRKIVVFIDDLDRCEPENVLNLLSAIKLFFTFGKRTIFICGLDEKAVDEAVKVKYKDVVKSGEYMEKIFDISFNMPKPNINKMIAYYFEDMPAAISGVRKFLEAMHFTNPRHIKKVLNKYLLLRYYKIPLSKYGDPIDSADLIPDQNVEFFRYLTLFIIILYKFNTVESNKFSVIRDYGEKINYWEGEWKEKKNIQVYNLQDLNFSQNNKYRTLQEIYNVCIKFLKPNSAEQEIDCSIIFIRKIISLFAPYIEATADITDSEGYGRQFIKKENNETEIGYAAYFCNYINQNHHILLNNDRLLLKEISDSTYCLWNIFDMAERYL